MTIFNSEESCLASATNSVGYTGLIEHDRGTETLIIKDALISDVVVATARAKAEFIKGGYSKRVINILSTHIPTLKQNSVFTYKGVNWFVKYISVSFKAPKLLQTTIGVRYE